LLPESGQLSAAIADAMLVRGLSSDEFALHTSALDYTLFRPAVPRLHAV